jgi:hypothetical protein
LLKIESASTPSERVAAVVANLRQRGTSKPRTVRTLNSTINALFHKSLPEAEIGLIIAELTKAGIIQVQQTKVSYTLPGE